MKLLLSLKNNVFHNKRMDNHCLKALFWCYQSCKSVFVSVLGCSSKKRGLVMPLILTEQVSHVQFDAFMTFEK